MSTMSHLENKDLVASDEVTLKYKQILSSNGVVEEVSEVIIDSSNLQGVGFCSKANYVAINFKNPAIQSLNLFVKTHTSNSSHSEMLIEAKLFEKESRFYMEYIPAAKEFCKSKGYDGLVDMYPKCYYGDNDLLVLENLVVDKGYALLNKQDQHNLDAVRHAIITLAKHHAVSYAFIQEMGGPEDFFKRFPNLDFEVFTQPTARAFLEPMINNAVKTNLQILQKSKPTAGKDEAIEFLKSYVGKAYEEVLDAVEIKTEQEKLFVLGHGDYWNANMMFKTDKKTNQIIGHLALDLQIVRYNSIGLDLAYYLLTSVKNEIRQEHLHEILGRYLDTLRNTARKLGHPINLTFGDLLLIFRRKVKYGFWFAMCFASGTEHDAFQDVDVNEMGELKNFGAVMHQSLQKWIDANPEKAGESAPTILDLVKEYKELSID